MLLQRIESAGLAHNSYILCDEDEAAVIDPRRDCNIYLDIAKQQGCELKYIFETHRNEDNVIGSKELAHISGAQIFHGAALRFLYGNGVYEGDIFDIGSFRLEVLETPGHTIESVSYVLYDTSAGSQPIGVFTGDALFIGDVGRTDLLGDPANAANLLYDSLFNKILQLGDGVIIYPAHGSGSICGNSISDRSFSTVGYEKHTNKALKYTDRTEFINFKTSEKHYIPPYFKHMETVNLEGPEVLIRPPLPKPYSPDDLETGVANGIRIVDIRSTEAFAGSHVPGSLHLPLKMIGAFGGYFLKYDDYIGIVAENHTDINDAVTELLRLDYTKVIAFLAGGMRAWQNAGKPFGTVETVYAGKIKERVEEGSKFTLLDVRTEREYEKVHLPGAVNIYLGQLAEKMDELPQERPIVILCGTGQRAMIAASILKMSGIDHVQNFQGSMAACGEIGCPIITGREPRLAKSRL